MHLPHCTTNFSASADVSTNTWQTVLPDFTALLTLLTLLTGVGQPPLAMPFRVNCVAALFGGRGVTTQHASWSYERAEFGAASKMVELLRHDVLDQLRPETSSKSEGMHRGGLCSRYGSRVKVWPQGLKVRLKGSGIHGDLGRCGTTEAVMNSVT